MKELVAFLLFLLLSSFQIPTLQSPAIMPSLEPTTSEPVESKVTTNYKHPQTEVPLSKVDFSSYKDELSAEDWKSLSDFFPVLLEGKTIMVGHLPSVGDPPLSLEELNLNNIFDSFNLEYSPDEFMLSSFTLCDLTGDGQKELVFYAQYTVGLYLILLRDGDTFYGATMRFRGFQGLQQDGIFSSSGGAATTYYQRLHFENGTFWVELLGNTDWDYFSINEQVVDEEEFEIWRKELLVGEVAWHVARAIQR